jgi:hypothetical protein
VRFGVVAIWPHLHSEEPFFSGVARYAEAMAPPDDRTLTELLFGSASYNSKEVPTGEFPGWLEQFVARLPPGHPYTVQGLLLRHTPLPYVAPFSTRRHVAFAIQQMRQSAPWADVKKPLFRDGHHHMMRGTLRYCTACVAADRARPGGLAHWRRVHQLTGVIACPEHRIGLRASWVGREWTPKADRDCGYPPGLCSLDKALALTEESALEGQSPLQGEKLEKALAVADDSLWLLRHPQMADSIGTVMERHRLRLAEAGWTDVRGRIRRKGLGELVDAWSAGLHVEEFGRHLLHNYWQNIYYQRFWRGPDEVVAFHHILLFRALGLSAPEFFAGPPPEVIRRTPRMWVQTAPCRNRLCARFDRTRMPLPGELSMTVVGCPECGYMYVQRSNGARAQVSTLRFGEVWDERLRALTAARTPLPDTARLLDTTESRVAWEVLRVRRWPPQWPSELRQEIQARARAVQGYSFDRSRHRSQWSSVTARRSGLQYAIGVAGHAFRYLLRFDRRWLAAHLDEPYVPRPDPPRSASPSKPPDQVPQPSGDVYDAAEFLRAWNGFPIPVSTTSVRMLLRKCEPTRLYDTVYSDVELFPYLDTRGSYALRRITWAARYLLVQGEDTGRDELAALARLTEAEQREFRSALDDAVAQVADIRSGAASPPAGWFPAERRRRWGEWLLQENFPRVVDNVTYIRSSFGSTHCDGAEEHMPKPSGGPKSIERRRREGFGEGEGADYKPWESKRSVPSHGKTHRIYGQKVGRTHLLFSDRELWCWYLLEWSTMVGDIREQYPLHELAETQEIAASLGYEHPTRSRIVNHQRIEEPKVMTVDFLVTLQEPASGTRYVAISVKTEENIRDPKHHIRLFEKEEIARRFWERRGIPFRFVTEAQMPPILVENLSLILHFQDLAGHGVPEDEVGPMLAHLYDHLRDAEGVPIHKVCSMMDERLRLPKGSSVRLVWHAIATRQWMVDMTVRLGPERPLVGLERGGRALRIA